MATATIAKTVPAPRRSRPSISTRNTLRNGLAGDDDSDDGNPPTEPLVLTRKHILKKFSGRQPSLIVHLHPTFFRFDNQEGTFSYKSEMKVFIEHLQRETIPHDMIDEFLRQGVQFYDGCLIVEIHNHSVKDVKTQKKADTADSNSNSRPFSIHNYNEHVTPSPYVPYPRKTEEPAHKKLKTSPEIGDSDKTKEESTVPETKPKQSTGPQIFTHVLFPTDLCRHNELVFLNKTLASDAKARKGSRDSTVPPTPTTAAARNAVAKKVILEDKDAYEFEAEYLLHTQPPLLLDPAKDADHAEKILDTLAHPLHSHPPPSTVSKKRRQADIAADDAQAAREERKMLVMDERVKPSVGASAGGDTQSASAAMGFTRFKTLETIKQRHEEKVRQRKEDEDRAQLEKRQQQQQEAQRRRMVAEEQQQQARRNAAEAQHQAHQQTLMRQQALHAQQQQQKMMHQQMAMNPQQQMLQQQAAMNNSSPPVVHNQAPMMASSPMGGNANMMQGGFPMQNSTSSQGVGSPLRPSSAMHHPGAMARQVSQQQHPSRNGTPQLPGATPLMANAMPMDINRQMTATPRMPTGSPAQNMNGTPNNGMINMATPQMNNQNLTPQQMMYMQNQQNQRRAQQMQQMQQIQQMQGQNASPEQMAMRQQQIARANMNPQQHAAQNYQQQLQRLQQQSLQNMQLQNNQQRPQQQQVSQGMNGGEAMISTNSQNQNVPMSAALLQQQQQVQHQQFLIKAKNQLNQQLAQAARQHGGQIPQHVRDAILTNHRSGVISHQQAITMRAQQAAQANAGLDVNDPEAYMRNLRGQAAQQQQQQQAMARMGNNGGMQPNAGNMQQQQQQGQQQQQQMGMGRGNVNNMTPQQIQAYQAMRQAQAQHQAQQQAQQQMQQMQQQQQQQMPTDLNQSFALAQNAFGRPGQGMQGMQDQGMQ